MTTITNLVVALMIVTSGEEEVKARVATELAERTPDGPYARTRRPSRPTRKDGFSKLPR